MARRAICTSSPTSPRTRSCAARTRSSSTTCSLSITQAALGARVTRAHGRWRGGGRDQGRARRRGARSVCAARGVPAPAPSGLTRRRPRAGRRPRVPAASRPRQRDLLEQLAVELGEVEPEDEASADGDAAAGAPDGEGTPKRGRRRGTQSRAPRPAAGRDQLSDEREVSRPGERGSSCRSRADQEAVEQVSEILSRACPGGVSVEAPFEVLEEGLAARVDASAAGGRAWLHHSR